MGLARAAGGSPHLPLTGSALRARRLARLDAIPAAQWDALFAADDPFVRHAFLSALERNGCVGGDSGWTPSHLLLENAAGEPVAAAPLYEKAHSYGEFVFDFAWARASHELGQPYYPKLLCAIPFTPVGGPRLGARDADARAALARALVQLPQAEARSSLHVLFADAAAADALSGQGLLERNDLQFHWRNEGYADFDAFLARLSHDKRKKILRERRRVAEAGLRFEMRTGSALDESEWAAVYALYSNTYEERGQAPYLSLSFFLDYGAAPGSPLRLILCLDGSRLVAVAITLAWQGTLYGRHWGCAERHHSLHFETCYYQGIELCIREGLMRFDAGAQGGHKRARGFDPVVTRSFHRLADPRLRAAVEQFLRRERAAVSEAQDELAAHSAYRHG